MKKRRVHKPHARAAKGGRPSGGGPLLAAAMRERAVNTRAQFDTEVQTAKAQANRAGWAIERMVAWLSKRWTRRDRQHLAAALRRAA